MQSLVAEISFGELSGAEEMTFGNIGDLQVGPEGHIVLFDLQVRALRIYDSTGRFVRTVGRRGAGPGEYEHANGIAVRRDGHVLLWDAGSARINHYSAAGDPIDSWPVPGGAGFSTTGALTVDTTGNAYIRTRVGDPPTHEDPSRTGRLFGITGLVRFSPTGSIVDSLRPPGWDVTSPSLMAQERGGTSLSGVPFWPQQYWAWSPLGYFVAGHADRYAVIEYPPGARMVRFDRDVPAVAVDAAEKANAEAISTWSMRQTEAGWKWNGPPIPDTKPLYRSLSVDLDGRIWVLLSQPGERIPADQLAARPPGDSAPRPPVREWREPTVYDVFGSDGRFLGRVPFPPRTTAFVMHGDRVWTVTRDSLDVQRVVRYRVTPGFGEVKRN
jgi:hypothetical protein